MWTDNMFSFCSRRSAQRRREIIGGGKALLLAFFAFLLSGILSAAPQADDSAVPAKANRIVRVGLFPFDGFLMTDKQGNRSGYGYDYLQELRNYSTWSFEYAPATEKWFDMLQQLEEGKLDIVPGVRKTPEREQSQKYAFSKYPLIKVFTLMTVKAGNTRYHAGDYANWNGMRVGLSRNSVQSLDFMDFAKEKGFTFEPVWFDKPDALVPALLDGSQIDAAITSSLRGINSGEWIYEQFNSTNMYIAVRKGDDALLDELNRTMGKLESNLPDLQDRLMRKYYTHKGGGILSFSEEEREFLNSVKSSGRVFTCLLHPDCKPFSWYANGAFHGIFKDYADEVSVRTGLPFKFLPLSTRKAYYEKKTSPDVDIVFDTVTNLYKAEQGHLRLTQPYFAVSMSVLRNKNAGNDVKTISVLEPGVMSQQIRESLPDGIKIRTCASLHELIDDIRNMRSDTAYLYTRIAEYVVYADEDRMLVSSYIPGMDSNFSIGIRDDLDPVLLSILNKAVLSFDDSFANVVRAKYEPKFKEVFSLSHFFHQHPLTSLGIPAIVLSLICMGLGYVLTRRKKIYQTGILFRNMPLRCFVMDEHGKFLYHTLGQRMPSDSNAPDMRGIDDVPDAEIRSLMRMKMEAVLKNGKPESVEFGFRGRRRSAAVAKLPDSAFGANMVLWISQDSTELQKSRDENLKHEEFFRLTLESIGEGVITTDADGNILMLNPAAERLIGIRSSEVIGKPHEKIFRIASAIEGKRCASPLHKALSDGKVVNLDDHTDLLALNGKRYHVSDCAAPIRSRDGKIIGGMWSGTRISTWSFSRIP